MAEAAGGAGPIERVLERDRLIVLVCVGALAGFGWWWIVRSAGAMPAMAQPWSAAWLLSAFAMWALMMAAMMLPSATPMILLYARFVRARGGGTPHILLFAGAYLAVWSAFSLLAALAQAALAGSGAVSTMAAGLGDRRLAALLLFAAGLYQLVPLKRSCLARCRSPLSFLTRYWRPGTGGALRLGLAHGLHCLGCCWALMLLLFAVGVMNLAWIAALTLLVLAEKTAQWDGLSRVLGVLLMAGGAALAVG